MSMDWDSIAEMLVLSLSKQEQVRG
jgi:hypothetical protein